VSEIGLIMEWLKKRSGNRPLLYILDWVFDLILAGAFIYMSYVFANYTYNCVCPFCHTTQLPINASENISKIINNSIR
jgi:hypothetical protein